MGGMSKVSGYTRKDGTVVQPFTRRCNPFCRWTMDDPPKPITPLAKVGGYTRQDGTVVLPYRRLPRAPKEK